MFLSGASLSINIDAHDINASSPSFSYIYCSPLIACLFLRVLSPSSEAVEQYAIPSVSLVARIIRSAGMCSSYWILTKSPTLRSAHLFVTNYFLALSNTWHLLALVYLSDSYLL